MFSESGRTSRRTVLKNAGLATLGAGVAAAVGVPLVAALRRGAPARSGIPRAGVLRIDQVTVVDPRDGRKRPGMSVLVRDGRIVSVAPVATVASPPGARVIDGADRFAVPGYNNMHTHVLQAKRSSLFMATMLAEGTTGMRQMAGSDDLLRHRAEGRLPLGADTPGLLAMPGAILMPFNAPSVKRARTEISRQKALGADFIKLIQVEREVFFDAVSWAHENGLAVAGHLPPTVSPDEASRAGYDSLEHLGTSSNIWIETSAERERLRGDQDTSFALPNWLGYVPFSQEMFSSDLATAATAKTLLNPALVDTSDDVALLQRALDSFDEGAAQKLAETFAENNTWQTPTLSRIRTAYVADAPEYENHPWLTMLSPQARSDYQEMRQRFIDLPPARRSAYHQYYDMALSMVKRLHDAGVRIMTGTDGPGGNPGQDMKSEFRQLAAAGLTPLDILRSATTAPAAYLGRSERMGAVAAGMEADILLLDADPLQNVENLGQISAVVRAGHFLTIREIGDTVDRLLASAEG